MKIITWVKHTLMRSTDLQRTLDKVVLCSVSSETKTTSICLYCYHGRKSKQREGDILPQLMSNFLYINTDRVVSPDIADMPISSAECNEVNNC